MRALTTSSYNGIVGEFLKLMAALDKLVEKKKKKLEKLSKQTDEASTEKNLATNAVTKLREIFDPKEVHYEVN